MIEFAVKVKGLDAEDDTKARWVLRTDAVGEKLLVARDDGSLHWYPLEDCTRVKAHTPDHPDLIMAVQPQKLVTPAIHLGRDGPIK